MHYDGFPFPITLSATGPLFSWPIAATRHWPHAARAQDDARRRVRNIFPIGFFTAVTYAAGNELYLFMSVSFIQMMKSLSRSSSCACSSFKLDVIMPKLVGVGPDVRDARRVLDEPTFSAVGIARMLFGETAEAMRMVFFQRSSARSGSGSSRLFYTCPGTSSSSASASRLRGVELTEERYYGRVVNNPAPYLLVSSAVILTTLGDPDAGARRSKPLPVNIGIIVVSVALFGDAVSTRRRRHAVNVVGFVAYQVVKTKEDLRALREDREGGAAEEEGTARTPLLDKAAGGSGAGSPEDGWGGEGRELARGETGSPTVRGNFAQIRAGASLGHAATQ